MSTPFRPNVLRMSPYSPGKPIDEVKRELGLTEVVKLASNENPLGPSPKAIAAVQAAAAQMHLYPDAAAYDLRRAIAEKFGLPASQILLGNGSDEIIHLLGQVFLGAEADEIIVGAPSFVRYDAAAQLADCGLVKVPLNAALEHDLPAMAEAVTENTKLLWIANPNNPTGTIVRKEALDRLFAVLPSHVTVVLDEAYCEFAADEPGYVTSLEYVKAGANVIGLRTMSKAYGLAGIRLGFGFASPATVDAVDRAREPFNCNSLAQVAAIAALGDEDHLRRSVESNAAGRRQLEAVLREVGGKPVETFANFVFADMGQPAQPIFEALLREGVIVRSGHVLGMPTYLRVSIGTHDENEKFAHALRAVMNRVTV